MKALKADTDLQVFFLKVSKAKASLLILDYDGTLAPFCERPDLAYPYVGVRERIKKLMSLKRTRVVIVSGRPLSSLKILLDLNPPPELWGCHGGERLLFLAKTPTEKKVDPLTKIILAQGAYLSQSLAPNLYTEIKPLSVALHWRDKNPVITLEQSTHVLDAWNNLALENSLEIHPFDGGVELRVSGINKGEAVKTLLSEILPDTPIAYLGDDMTDEEAFAVLKGRALKVLVRTTSKPTQADIHLIPPEELLKFLDMWIQTQTEGSS